MAAKSRSTCGAIPLLEGTADPRLLPFPFAFSEARIRPRLLPTVLAFGLFLVFAGARAAIPDNVTQIENAKAGTSAWQLTSFAFNAEIEGYASLTSVNRGGQIRLYVNTSEPTYTLEIFRTGWYGGAGGRRMTNPVTRTGTAQPIPQPDPVTGMIECNWTDPYVLSIPATPTDPSDPAYWASGVYVVKLTAGTSGRQSYILFVVRDDARNSDYLFQATFTTYQAYNSWGGKSMYGIAPSVKASFNRPYSIDFGAGYYRIWEYNMVRFLEREGYDVSYCTDVDTHENPNLLLSHRALLSVGHDEYWSWQMRASVEAARDQGVGLGFFSANDCYWQIRFEPSPISGDPDRTMVCYRTSTADPYGSDGDPTNDYLITNLWRQNTARPPEEALIGIMYVTSAVDADLAIEDPSHWICSGTGLTAGDRLPGLVGTEADRIFGNGPAAVSRFAHSPFWSSAGQAYFSDAGSYTASSGATVVGIGSFQWNWGLDDWGTPSGHTYRVHAAAQQMTHNALARFVEPKPGGSISVTASVSPQPVTLGENATFVLTVRNGGSASLTNVVLTDDLPSGLAAQSVSSSAGSCGSSAGRVSCSFASLAAGDTATVTIVAGTTRTGALKTVVGVSSDQPGGSGTFAKLARVVGPGFSPIAGPEGVLVTIYGTNLTGASAVAFNGVSASFVVESSSQISAHVPSGAATGTLTVTTGSGTATLGTFSVVPFVTGFSPRTGLAGASVTVAGKSFTGATAVKFNGKAASFTVDSPTQITAVVPSGATTGKMSVTAPGGTGTSAMAFGVTSISVTGVSPAAGPAGSTVSLTGANFSGASNITLNDRSAAFTVVSSSQIDVVVPANATSGPISVTAAAGTATSSTSFSVTSPSISLFFPSSGPPGTTVSLDGGSFTGATSVTFGGAGATFTVVSPTRLVATVPVGALSGSIGVSTPAGSTTSSSFSFQPGSFTVTSGAGPPTVAGFSPTSGAAGAGVTISGGNFGGATSVTFNGTASTFTVDSATQVTAAVPSGATSGPIAVTTPGGTAASAASFTVTPPPPSVSGFSPSSGASGTSVVISGANFGGATSVTFNGTASSFNVDSPAQITAAVPSGATSGPIAVTTPGGTSGSLSVFTVLPPPPSVTGFNPTSGAAGASVVISGTNFAGATSVTFSGTAASFAVNSGTQITATVPSGATSGPIAVTTPGGTAASAAGFTVLTTPPATTSTDNVVQIENAKPGTTAWQLTSTVTNHEVEGYASLTSVNRGGQISFFVNTNEPTYTLEVFRTGWYGGAGGRRLVGPVTRTGVAQPIPQPDASTGLIECNWTDPYTLAIADTPDPSDPGYWASGVYLVKLTGGTSGRQSYIVFVVRDDARPSDYLFQSTVTTYAAYNGWGGRSLYSSPRSYKVSFNRPNSQGNGAGRYVLWEFNMVRFLEREGYDVTYSTDVDTHENGAQILSHRGLLSVGHDEYWSSQMRANVEAARDRGVNVAFFGGNDVYWQIRFEASGLTGAPDRTVVGYKEFATTQDPLAIDGDPTNDYLVTGKWWDPPVNRPAEPLMGVMYLTAPVDADMVIEDAAHWICAGTGLSSGDHLPGVVGDEVDRVFGTGPVTTRRFGHSPFTSSRGVSYAADSVSYTAPSGANVVAFGSHEWSWGLDDWNVPSLHTSRLHAAAQQMTHNLLTRFADSPGTPGSAVTIVSTASPQPATVGGVLTLVLNVRNQGFRSLTNVVLTDSLPSGMTYQSASSNAGPCSPVAGGVSCPLGQIDVNGTATVSLVASADRSGAWKNGIGVAADQPEGQSRASNLLRVVPAGVSPLSGPEGAFVLLYGLNFAGATAVQFNGVAASFTVNSANQIGAYVPPGATKGPVTVTTGSGVVNVGTFSVTPSVAGFSPPAGPAGTTVTITGRSFTGVTSVKFLGTSAAFTVNSPSQITATVPSGAVTNKITVTTANGSGTSTGYFNVTSVSITGFSPASGPAGSTVVVTGTNFTGTNSVYLNDRPASFTLVSSTQINVVVPSNCTSGPISVSTTAGAAYSSTSFTVTTPSLSLFFPGSGPAGTSVFIDGGNLTGATSVKFNGTPASYTVSSANRLVATVPFGATTGKITVTTPGGTGTSAAYSLQPGSFTVTPAGPPTIGGFAPSGGPVGASVVVTGTNLGGTTAVQFNGASTSFTVNSTTQVTATVPAAATTGPISVTTPGGTATSTAPFTVIPAPTISGFSPTSGPVGTSVVITGTNLTGATSVQFNGTSAAFTVNSAAQITAAVPAGAATGPISVTTPGGTATSAGAFAVIGPPTIGGFAPSSGSVGATVVITGTNFSGATSVQFNGTSAAFTVNSSTQITASVPAGATTGPISVTTPGGTATSTAGFTVVGSPTITGFAPSGGPVGTSVVITGTNLTGATSVQFNGTGAAFTANSSTQVTATVPAGATTGTISVTTPGGTATSSAAFAVKSATISGFKPAGGPAGASVVINGTNIGAASSVRFNGTDSTFAVDSASQITATVPAGATSGPISVSTTDAGTATSVANFAIGPGPVISEFTLASGAVGDVVSIVGSGFDAVSAVRFGGVDAAYFAVNGSAQITATVPLGAPTGRIEVSGPGGGGIAATDFTVTAFSPVLGPVNTSVTITGADFTGATSVTFQGVAAAFTVDSDRQITAIVPDGAASGPISVVSPGGTFASGSDFTVVPFSPLLGPVGSTVVIRGSGFTEVSAVTFNGAGAVFTVDSDTQISATVPSGATSGPIAITLEGGTFSTTTDFTVTPFSPVSGAAGDSVVIAGGGFTTATGVSFNGIPTSFTVDSEVQITATVPPNATTGPISVATTAGTSTTPSHFQVSSPALVRFAPGGGVSGDSVVILGAHLAGATSVEFHGTAATFAVDAPIQITAVVPAGATNGPIRVLFPSGSVTSSQDFVLTASAIASFNPASGSAGTSVVITGTNLSGATAVNFNGAAAAFTVDSGTQITATVPANATTGPLSVATPGGTSTSSGNFTVVPTIGGFSPTSGPAGAPVTITGTGLGDATSVQFNGASATFTVSSPTQVTATVPATAATGKISVATGGGTATSANVFTVAPTIGSFTPASGPVGTSVTITGTALSGATSVKFNGTSASFTVNSSTQITATAPSGAATGPVSVTTPGGTATSAVSFAVAPKITSFSPASGTVGTNVVITGTTFIGATSVAFNGVGATFTVNSSTQVTATVPAASTTGKISITTAGGTAASATNFTVTPTITSFSPTSGPVRATVVITGTALTGAIAVRFNGTGAPFTVNSSTQVTATVPVAATTGKISVVTGGGTATSTTNFAVTPTISSFTPTSGPVGTSVVISGNGVTGASSVTFNGASASFTVNSVTQVTATVPAAATTGKISITTAGGTGTSTSNFTVAPAITGFGPASGPVGTSVVITGTTLTGATSVKFNGKAATFTVNSSSQVTATVPAGATTGKISITTPGGTATSAASFTVTP